MCQKKIGSGLPLHPHPQIDTIYTACEEWTKNLPPHLDKIQKNSYFFGRSSLRNAEMHNAKDVQQTSRAHQRVKDNKNCYFCPLFQLIVKENFEFSKQYCIEGGGSLLTTNRYYVCKK